MSADPQTDCTTARRQLGLDPEERPGDSRSERAYVHYSSCESCRRYYQSQRALGRRLRRLALAVGGAPPWLAGRVSAALDRGDAPPRNTSRRPAGR